MNHLNSVLIEGVIHIPPKFFNKGQKFVIASNWFNKTEKGIEKEINLFEVAAYEKLGEAVLAKAEKGREVRVVGRMRQVYERDEIPKFIIISEHIEFKPEFKGDKKNAE
jgi:single-strand DNA-binding protein